VTYPRLESSQQWIVLPLATARATTDRALALASLQCLGEVLVPGTPEGFLEIGVPPGFLVRGSEEAFIDVGGLR